ncbi:MAG: hypothetical protein V1767_01080 [Chloroflexota bacterium]
MTFITQYFCPVCGTNHGPRKIRDEEHKWGRYKERVNFWETLEERLNPDRPFGMIQESTGYKQLSKAIYITPDQDTEIDPVTKGSRILPFIRNRILSVLKEWIEKGWIDKGDIQGIVENTPQGDAPGPPNPLKLVPTPRKSKEEKKKKEEEVAKETPGRKRSSASKKKEAAAKAAVEVKKAKKYYVQVVDQDDKEKARVSYDTLTDARKAALVIFNEGKSGEVYVWEGNENSFTEEEKNLKFSSIDLKAAGVKPKVTVAKEAAQKAKKETKETSEKEAKKEPESKKEANIQSRIKLMSEGLWVQDKDGKKWWVYNKSGTSQYQVLSLDNPWASPDLLEIYLIDKELEKDEQPSIEEIRDAVTSTYQTKGKVKGHTFPKSENEYTPGKYKGKIFYYHSYEGRNYFLPPAMWETKIGKKPVNTATEEEYNAFVSENREREKQWAVTEAVKKQKAIEADKAALEKAFALVKVGDLVQDMEGRTWEVIGKTKDTLNVKNEKGLITVRDITEIIPVVIEKPATVTPAPKPPDMIMIGGKAVRPSQAQLQEFKVNKWINITGGTVTDQISADKFIGMVKSAPERFRIRMMINNEEDFFRVEPEKPKVQTITHTEGPPLKKAIRLTDDTGHDIFVEETDAILQSQFGHIGEWGDFITIKDQNDANFALEALRFGWDKPMMKKMEPWHFRIQARNSYPGNKMVIISSPVEPEKPKSETKTPPAETIDAIRSRLSALMIEDNPKTGKSVMPASIKNLRKAMAGFDEDKFENWQDLEEAIDEFEGIERSDYDSMEEYGEARRDAFNEIKDFIEGELELVEEEEE